MKVFNPKVKRITRGYYWGAYAVGLVTSLIIAALLAKEYLYHDQRIMNGLWILFFVLQFMYLTIINIKRFHDAGESVGYYLLCLVLSPIIVGDVMIFRVLIRDSDVDNEWGPNEERIEYEKNREIYGK